MIGKVDNFSDLPLLERAKYLSDNATHWTEENPPSCEENWNVRDKPYEYLNLQADILDSIGGNIIVEIGSARQAMNHDFDTINVQCCTDGHSTFFWARTEKEVHTVDITNYASILIGVKSTYPDNFNAYVGDGIKFLEDFTKQIDLLFLDAWDVDVTDYDKNHLIAFEAAQGKLADKHIIGIDDTDVHAGGKGRCLIPRLNELGYTKITDGRQTIFTNFDLNNVS